MRARPIIAKPGVLAAVTLALGVSSAWSATLLSPDGRLRAELDVDTAGQLVYTVYRDGQPVVEPSPLGVTVQDVKLGAGVALGAAEPYALDETYPARGVHAWARNRCRGLRLRVTQRADRSEWTLDCRAYDDGFAFRYEVPGEGARSVRDETTAFTLPAGSRCWFFERTSDWKLKTYAGLWQSAPVAAMLTVSPGGPVQGPPLLFELPDRRGYVALSEAALFNYSGMRLAAVGERTFQVNFTEPQGFELLGPFRTPWRVVLVSSNLHGLVNTDLFTHLCPAPDAQLFADTSYIQPGRCVWRWWSEGTGTPEQERQYVDHAADLGFEYSLIDEGWKDWPEPWVTLRELCSYAGSRNVGVWVWCHWQDINDPADDYAVLAGYLQRVADAGAAGVKIDFMNGEDLVRVRFNEAVLRHAAQRRLMVNFHGCGKPTGESRTYPNELTREGIRGLELNRMNEPLPADHDAALPFTRLIVGAGDYTPLTVAADRLGATSVAHQLATFIAFTSPLQVLAENPQKLLAEPGWQPIVKLLRAVPTTWDETRVLRGSAIGELAVLARRKGAIWYVAGVNGPQARAYNLATDFLDGPTWSAEVISDGDQPVAIRSAIREIQRGESIALTMLAGGGFAMRLSPLDANGGAWQLQQRDSGWAIVSDAYTLNIDSSGCRFGFERANPAWNVPAHATHGVEVDGSAVTRVTTVERQDDRLILTVKVQSGAMARIEVQPGRHHVTFDIAFSKLGDVAFQLGGLAPAFGLGDHGGQHTSANLSGFSATRMHNDGGSYKCRFFAPFVIFPAQRFAGVVFWPGEVSVALRPEAYRIEAHAAPRARFTYFVGDLPEIYADYRQVRAAEGFPDVKPQFRIFELGWESWDALRWDTNAQTVQAILTRYLEHGYPIRWAVTGSGFWPEGGTTTSFGAWHAGKYPDPPSLRAWMHDRDIDWMIGLRTNFAVADGPFTPVGAARDFFMRSPDGTPVVRKSTAFPRFDCYVLDGTRPAAAQWFADLYARWGVDGVKEDTMLKLPRADGFNGPMAALAERGALVMARNAAYTCPGTLLRMEDMVQIETITARMPITFLQYAASAAPNVYCDAVGFGGMADNPHGAIRHAWLSALTAGMAVGAEPWHWAAQDQASLEKAIRMHTALAPYLYSAALDSFATGYPSTLTPLPIAFPDDVQTYDLARHESPQYEWMVGPNLLAAPFLRTDYRTNDRMDIYLPAGEWLDFDNGERFTGPTVLKDCAMPLDKTPCFVGGAGILVLRGAAPLELHAVVYPLAPRSGAYRFTYPDGLATTRITKDNTGWNYQSLRVTDVASGEAVRFTRTDANGALRFAIEPDHDYRITGGGDDAKTTDR